MARSRVGLTEQDLDELRQRLAEGKRPRVQLSGPHFPVGAAGTVVRIGSPDADGPDFVRVRVKVNGMTDELAFAPGELSVRRPGSRTAKAGAAKTARPARAAGPARAEPARAEPARAAGPAKARPTKAPPARATHPGAGSPAPAGAGGAASAEARPTEASPTKASPTKASPAKASPAKASPATATAAARSEPAKAAGRRRKAATPTVSFTVNSPGANWTLTVTRGNKNLVRNAQLPPGVVDAAAELFGQPALAEAVSEINDAALAEARARAERLRAELDELEAVLATHRRP